MEKTYDFEEKVLELFARVHSLDRVPRSGYLIRGVTAPESVAAHTHFTALLGMLFTREYPEFDEARVMELILIHDLGEAELMDIPMPVGSKYLKEAKQKAETALLTEMFAHFRPSVTPLIRELMEAETPEARLVKGLDKVQMMIKVMNYQRENRGDLAEFWQNPANFRDYGIEGIKKLFHALLKKAGKQHPGKM